MLSGGLSGWWGWWIGLDQAPICHIIIKNLFRAINSIGSTSWPFVTHLMKCSKRSCTWNVGSSSSTCKASCHRPAFSQALIKEPQVTTLGFKPQVHSGAIWCHPGSGYVHAFPKHRNPPSSATWNLSQPFAQVARQMTTLYGLHMTIRLSASQHFNLQDSERIPGSNLQKWQATAPHECRVQGNSLLPSPTFGTRTNYLAACANEALKQCLAVSQWNQLMKLSHCIVCDNIRK